MKVSLNRHLEAIKTTACLCILLGTSMSFSIAATKPQGDDRRVERGYKDLLDLKADSAIRSLSGPLIEALRTNEADSRQRAARYLLLIAYAFRLDDNDAAAADCASTAARLDPKNTLALCYAADYLLRSGQIKAAENLYGQLEKFEPKDNIILRTLGWRKYLHSETKEARKLLQQAADKNDSVGLRKLALLLAGQGETAKAVTTIDEAARTAESPYLRHIQQGMAADWKRDLNEAERQFRAAGKLLPDDPKWHESLALLLMEQNKIKEAGEEFQKAINCPRFSATAYHRYAIYLHFEKQYDAAKQVINRAESFRPYSSDALCTKATIDLNPENQELYFRQALRNNPYCAPAYRGLSALPKIKQNAKAYQKLLEDWNKASPHSLSYLQAKADLLRQQGNWQKAIETYKAAFSSAPKGDPLTDHCQRLQFCKQTASFGDCYYQDKQYDLAFEQAQIFNKAKGAPEMKGDIPTRPPNIDFNRLKPGSNEYAAARHGILADLLYECGKLDDAAREYQDAIALEPENIAWHAGLLKVYLDKRDVAGIAKEDSVVTQHIISKTIPKMFQDFGNSPTR